MLVYFRGKFMKKIRGKNIVVLLVGIISLLLILYSIINIIDWNSSNKENNDIKKHISKVVKTKDDETEINWNKLKQENSDTVGYIKIENTKIDYIIVKTNDNDYYLDHNFNKKYSKAGWVFANYKNKLDGTDKNISLFGHARLDGSMFGSLKKTLTEEWQKNKENYDILFMTETNKYKYRVFSTYRIKDEDYYIKTEFIENEFGGFIKSLKERSNFDYNIEVEENDKILTLSTCDINNDYRIVLHAKLMK